MSEHDDLRGEKDDDALASLLRLAGPRPAPPAERTARVRAAVQAEWLQATQKRARTRRLALGSLAAAAALLLALGVWRREPPPRRVLEAPETPGIALLERIAGPETGLNARTPGAARPVALRVGQAPAAGTWLETAPGTRAALRLSGGSSLRLDAATRVQLVSASVLALERGALYVDSGPANTARVLVRTPGGLARELGTQFEVRVLGPDVRVRVREGAVRLERAGQEGGEARGGDELLTRGPLITRSPVALHGPEWRWVLESAPAFALEGRTLAHFLEWACRENGWKLRFASAEASAAAGQVRLHGQIEGLDPAQALAAVVPTTGFRQRQDGDTLWVARTAGGKGR